jgi:hypothetical protein
MEDPSLGYRGWLPIRVIEFVQLALDALPELFHARLTLCAVKFLSRLLTALNLLPSMATIASENRSSLRLSSTNSRHTLRIASPLSLRKSAVVLKSGVSRKPERTATGPQGRTA